MGFIPQCEVAAIGVKQLAQPVGHGLQRRRQARLGNDRARDVVEQRQVALMSLGGRPRRPFVFEQPGIFDRDRRLLREQGQQLLVGLGKAPRLRVGLEITRPPACV
jgi:hypothetical protein